MIVQKPIPYSKIKSKLKKTDEIGILSCNACSRLCGIGGEKAMKEMQKKLEKDGFTVVDADLIGTPCNSALLKKSELKGNTNVVLACDAAVYNMKKLFPKNKIVQTGETLGIGVHNNGKNIHLVTKVR
ncbi:hypothetical protein ISS08_01605 [Candidatus Pacearchaeota archaeon]|nr:hypothetical protein [Candidatus Pacearchaeota archaeon]